MRVAKMIKDRNKLARSFESIIKIKIGLERLLFFLLVFIILQHISCCLWIVTANFDKTT